MALTRLKNVFTSKTGRCLYVNSDDFDASDAFDNRGNSGRIKYFDVLRGIIYFDCHEYRNNLDYSLLKFRDINQEVRVLDNNNLLRSHTNKMRPVATTVPRIAAVNTTPATEFIDQNGVELLVSGVSMIKEHQYLVKQKQVADATTFELGGLVLGSYQSIYVKSTAAVTATLICLLYTSPSPRDGLLSRMPSSA